MKITKGNIKHKQGITDVARGSNLGSYGTNDYNELVHFTQKDKKLNTCVNSGMLDLTFEFKLNFSLQNKGYRLTNLA